MIELALNISKQNLYPIAGAYIRGNDIQIWLEILEKILPNFRRTKLFPIPDKTPNSIHGLLILSPDIQNTEIFPIEKTVQFSEQLYLLDKTTIYPYASRNEIASLLNGKTAFWHPTVGLCPLEIEWDIRHSISLMPTLDSDKVETPIAGSHMPNRIHSFEVIEVSPEEVLKKLEEDIFPKRKELDDAPLSLFEQLKRQTYSLLFQTSKNDKGGFDIKEGNLLQAFRTILSKLGSGNEQWIDNMKSDLGDLEKRNQDRLQKLLDMFQQNMEEALKYAVPLDENSSNRGPQKELFNFNKRWWDYSLFQNSGSNGSGSYTMPGDAYWKLNQQYHDTAKELINKKDYEKAAFVYLKLLKNPALAASTLEDGKLYVQAASVYQKICLDNNKAAECYEKGSLYQNAIELYKELTKFEKAGDLYTILNKKNEANEHFKLAVDDHIQKKQYIHASEILQNKMQLFQDAQSLLKNGWNENIDPFNCLNKYFKNIPHEEKVWTEIEEIKNDLPHEEKKIIHFMNAIKKQSINHEILTPKIKNMVYELIAEHVDDSPNIVEEITNYEKQDKELVKDVLKWKTKQKRRV